MLERLSYRNNDNKSREGFNVLIEVKGNNVFDNIIVRYGGDNVFSNIVVDMEQTSSDQNGPSPKGRNK